MTNRNTFTRYNSYLAYDKLFTVDRMNCTQPTVITRARQEFIWYVPLTYPHILTAISRKHNVYGRAVTAAFWCFLEDLFSLSERTSAVTEQQEQSIRSSITYKIPRKKNALKIANWYASYLLVLCTARFVIFLT